MTMEPNRQTLTAPLRSETVPLLRPIMTSLLRRTMAPMSLRTAPRLRLRTAHLLRPLMAPLGPTMVPLRPLMAPLLRPPKVPLASLSNSRNIVCKSPHRETGINLLIQYLPVNFPPQSQMHQFKEGETVTVHGFISKRRDISKKLSFVDLIVNGGPNFQFKSSWEGNVSPEHHLHKALKKIPAWSSVCLTGKIDKVEPSTRSYGFDFPANIGSYNMTLHDVHELSPFPRDIIISDGAQFPPHARHLQMRFDNVLQDRLHLRQTLTRSAQRFLHDAHFQHVETPVLFKSTPEGAREFLVPTRRPGYAYALPQSPQQYKQILMSAGVRGYYQFARCFRDEDLRADRQPEFTQVRRTLFLSLSLLLLDIHEPAANSQ